MSQSTHRRPTLRRLRFAVVLALTALALSACTIYVRPGGSTDIGVSLNDVIVEFRPTRGDGASYRVGEYIEFVIRTTQSGYVTLSTMDADGRVSVFQRNIYVPGGRTVILPTSDMNVVYTAEPPRGFLRVRASFTSGRTDVGRVSYRGRSGDGSWSTAIQVDIRGYPVRDVASTSLTVR